MMMTFKRAAVACALVLAVVGAPAFGSVVFAQDGTAQPETTQVTQPVQTEDNEFPWGLLGLLGLGGLAGLRRREEPRRMQTVDASRHA